MNGQRNAEFLDAITPQAREMILVAIAVRHGITTHAALAEVVDSEAESLLDYLNEPERGAASVLMQRH